MHQRPPRLSVIVAVVSDTIDGRTDAAPLVACLSALDRQRVSVSVPIEVIVATHPNVEGLDRARIAFPAVRWLVVTDLATYRIGQSSREHHDELRARGLAAARGELIALIEDHAVPAPDWMVQILAADWQRYGAIGGAIDNGVDRPLSWAAYLCDFLRYQNPIADGPSPIASDANVTYRHDVIDRLRAVWHPMYREPAVHDAIQEAGWGLALSPRIVIWQNRQNLTLGDALRERYVWGRSYAAQRGRSWPAVRRVVYGLLGPALWVLLVARTLLGAAQRPRARQGLRRGGPAVALLLAAWSLGETMGYWSSPAPEAATHARMATADLDAPPADERPVSHPSGT